MSNYIIAGEAGTSDLVDCEYLGKKLEASTPSTCVHVIAKHSSEWNEFLKKICNSYGFKEPSSPIIFTVDGQLIGDKQAFKEHVLQLYSVRGELDKNLRGLISDYDRMNLENYRLKQAEGPTIEEKVKTRIKDTVNQGRMVILDGFYEKQYDSGFEFWVKESNLLNPFAYDEFNYWAEDIPFLEAPELVISTIDEDVEIQDENQEFGDFTGENEEEIKIEEEKQSELVDKEKSPSGNESPLHTQEDEVNSALLNYEVDDKNIRNFIEYFTNQNVTTEVLENIISIPIPESIKSIAISDQNIIMILPKDYILALSPYPLIPEEMVVFNGKLSEGGWLLRDCSMMPNWLKLITIPPQKPVYKDGDILQPVMIKEPVYIKDLSSSCLNQRGFTYRLLELSYECSKDSTLKLNTLSIHVRHILTENDWEAWYKAIKDLSAIGYYQLLPYGEMNYQPIRSGQMLVSLLPIKNVSMGSFDEILKGYSDEKDFFEVAEFDFDHVFYNFPKNLTSRVIGDAYISAIERLDIVHKDFDCGVNILITSGFMMVVPIYRPYANSFGRNLFPDPLWYCGIINKPIVEKQWPETSGKMTMRKPFEIMRMCSRFTIDG
ncbi:hypothetical protein SteCoe_15095 [Stentor coeruleus]|uniref:Uncharacterized protein n=1 Tax=Stentor coeruleus TaxID=5963 RepID=A0A1R2C4G9_9CILI|nr:hypothetical protein SteCoe_15095 [Stentor coeruleus]